MSHGSANVAQPSAKRSKSRGRGRADTPKSAGQNAAIDARSLIDDADQTIQLILEETATTLILVARRGHDRINAARATLRDRAASAYREVA